MNMKITLLTGKTFDIAREAGIELKVVCSGRAKRLGLRIDSKKRIPVLTVPRFCSRRQALDFINSQKPWIEEHLQKLPEQKQFADGDEIVLYGQKLVIRHCPEMRAGAAVEEGFLKVSGDISFLPRRVRDYIKKQAYDRLSELSAQKALQIECKINRIVIKDTKSRWGSCSSLNNINYSWRIMLAPLKVIDYLAAHEVAHLKHHDHSENFWRCVEFLAEDAAFGRSWLKKNGAELNRYI